MANEIPYVPEWKLAAGVGFKAEKWGASLDANYVGSTWGTGYNGDPRPGSQTSPRRANRRPAGFQPRLPTTKSTSTSR